MFESSFINDVLNRTDIIEIVSRGVELKKAGKDYQGLCPFHAEKTPSFNISSDRGMYYCYGCGVGGDMFTFIEEIFLARTLRKKR